jgi:quinol monooxygenase YgiN/uncharacterized membrane protein YhaH (DUF805 family)
MMLYFRGGNFLDLWSSLLLVSLVFLPAGSYQQNACKAFAMLWYWWRVLGISSRSLHQVGISLYPILMAMYSVIPPLIVTFVIFCGLWQAIDLLIFEVDESPESTNRTKHTFIKIFYFSWVGDLEGLDTYTLQDPLLQGCMLLTTLLFSVYILNIFIGIISDAYNKETSTVLQTLNKMRARAILAFLLRASVLPSTNCSKIAAPLQSLALGGLVFVQAASVFGTSVTETQSMLLQTLLLLTANLAVFLRGGGAVPWKTGSTDARVHYLWMVSPQHAEEEDPVVKTLAERLERDRYCRKERERPLKLKQHKAEQTAFVDSICERLRSQQEVQLDRLLEKHEQRLQVQFHEAMKTSAKLAPTPMPAAKGSEGTSRPRGQHNRAAQASVARASSVGKAREGGEDHDELPFDSPRAGSARSFVAVFTEFLVELEDVPEFLRLTRGLAEEAITQNGCLTFDVMSVARSATMFITYEAYVSAAALEETKRTPRYRAWVDFQSTHMVEVRAQRGLPAPRIEST